MKLTIGMPALYDFSGVLFTVQSIRNMADEWENFKDEVEILVVDNTPSQKYREALKKQLSEMSNVRYIEFLAERGPAEVKNQVISNAKGEYTLCIDCHILFKSGTLRRLKKFLSELSETESLNMYTGPLLSNSGLLYTHFKPVWRHQMYGTWAIDEEILKQEEPQSIWGTGCGLFLVKSREWLGFNKNFKGFGAEEGYIHEKYRKFGRDVKCIPWLTWWHRFDNPDAKHYNLSVFSKVRNYVLGHLELGMELTPIYDHFVSLEHPNHPSLVEHLVAEHGANLEDIKNYTEEKLVSIHKQHKLSEEVWNSLLADPISYDSIPTPKTQAVVENNQQAENAVRTFSDIYKSVKEEKENYLKPMFDTIMAYAANVKSVGDISDNKYSIVPMIEAGRPQIKSLLYQGEPHPLVKKDIVQQFQSFEEAVQEYMDNYEFDMLYVAIPRNYPNYYEVLSKLASKVKSYLFVSNTAVSYSTRTVGEGLKEFVESDNGWHIHYHTQNAGGITIFTKTKLESNADIRPWLPRYGVGLELKALLSKIGINASENCACNGKAMAMDALGIEWCESNTDIILGWLAEEAKNRKLFYHKVMGKTILKLAIYSAKRKKAKLEKEEARLSKKEKNARNIIKQNV